MRSTLFLLMTLAFSFGNDAVAQETDFFWSDRDLNSGAVNQPLVLGSKSIGDTGSLFLYYSTSGPSEADIDVGAIMDIATSQPGVIRFTDAEVFDIQGRRWAMDLACAAASGQRGTVFNDFINEWGGFTLSNNGIRATNKLLDPGYDADADAFLFGRVDYEVIGEGCVQIHTGRGQLGIANVRNAPFIPFSENNFIDPAFGSAQVSSLGDAFILGDVNVDGSIDFDDIAAFVDLIQSGRFSNEGDTNCDGVVSFLDIQSFVDLLLGTKGFEVIDPSEENTVPQFNRLGDATNDGFIDLLDVTCFRFIGRDCGFFFTSDIDGNGAVDFADICPFFEIVLDQN